MMARLTSGKLVLEIRYHGIDAEGRVEYDIVFQWNGGPIARTESVRHSGEDSDRGFTGVFHASECRQDTLTPVLHWFVEKHLPVCWEPFAPDVRIILKAGSPGHVAQSEETALAGEAAAKVSQRFKDALAGYGVQEPYEGDPTMIVQISTYNFRDNSAFPEDRIAFVLNPTWAELTSFLTELELEYAAVRRGPQSSENESAGRQSRKGVAC